MKRDEIKSIFPEATDEQLKSIMDLNGADVEKAKSKATALETELKEKKADFDKLNGELETLKTANASGEEWKTKYEAIVAENEAKAKQAEAERILKEKQENVLNRFNAVVGDKKFSHDAVKADYLKKFGEALENKDFEGKSDADVFHALTKDDASAFVGVTTVKLAGGRPQGVGGAGKYNSREEIINIKDVATRQAEMLAHPHLFPEIKV